MKIQELITKISEGYLDSAFTSLYGEENVIAERARYTEAVKEFAAIYGEGYEVFSCKSERLLTHDVLSCSETSLNLFSVLLVGSSNKNRIYLLVIYYIKVVGGTSILGDIILLTYCLKFLGIDVTDHTDLRAVINCALEMMSAHAKAYYANDQLFYLHF